jgi:hypothetical protein
MSPRRPFAALRTAAPPSATSLREGLTHFRVNRRVTCVSVAQYQDVPFRLAAGGERRFGQVEQDAFSEANLTGNYASDRQRRLEPVRKRRPALFDFRI